jgi:glycosyltransferase involved in cell wall biosynthesis
VNFVKVPKLFSKTFLSNLIIKRHITLVHINSLLAKEIAPAARRLGCKVIFHLREDLEFFQKDLPFVKKWANRVIVISKSMTPFLQALKIRAEVVYNSFEAPALLTPAPKKVSRNKEIFVVGTIETRKGQYLAVQALSRLIQNETALRLNIVGAVLHSEKTYLRKLKKEIREFGLEKQVKFWGTQNEMSSIYQQADLVLIPSLAEPFGRVAIEAGYYGKPVICSNRGGLPEIVVNGKTGFVFNPDKLNDLADKVEQFLNLSQKEKLAMGLKGQERVLKLFNVETMIHKIKKIYEEELENQ